MLVTTHFSEYFCDNRLLGDNDNNMSFVHLDVFIKEEDDEDGGGGGDDDDEVIFLYK